MGADKTSSTRDKMTHGKSLQQCPVIVLSLPLSTIEFSKATAQYRNTDSKPQQTSDREQSFLSLSSQISQ